jgi:hypothetical protein
LTPADNALSPTGQRCPNSGFTLGFTQANFFCKPHQDLRMRLVPMVNHPFFLETSPAMLRRRFLALAPQATALSALAFSPAFLRNAYAEEGVNAKTITIGSSGALTGPLAGFGSSMKMGVDAAMTQINAKGGVRGRQLQFQLVDDAYVPQRTAENVKKMIADNSVFALMSCIGTPNNTAILPMIDEDGMPESLFMNSLGSRKALCGMRG